MVSFVLPCDVNSVFTFLFIALIMLVEVKTSDNVKEWMILVAWFAQFEPSPLRLQCHSFFFPFQEMQGALYSDGSDHIKNGLPIGALKMKNVSVTSPASPVSSVFVLSVLCILTPFFGQGVPTIAIGRHILIGKKAQTRIFFFFVFVPLIPRIVVPASWLYLFAASQYTVRWPSKNPWQFWSGGLVISQIMHLERIPYISWPWSVTSIEPHLIIKDFFFMALWFVFFVNFLLQARHKLLFTNRPQIVTSFAT